jgi:hypothetical protein
VPGSGTLLISRMFMIATVSEQPTNPARYVPGPVNALAPDQKKP